MPKSDIGQRYRNTFVRINHVVVKFLLQNHLHILFCFSFLEWLTTCPKVLFYEVLAFSSSARIDEVF